MTWSPQRLWPGFWVRRSGQWGARLMDGLFTAEWRWKSWSSSLLFYRPLGRTKLCRWKLFASDMKRNGSSSWTLRQQRHAGVWMTAGGWETAEKWHSGGWGGGDGDGDRQIKGKSGSSSSFSRHAALLTGLENSSLFKGLWFTPQHKPTVI